MSQMRINVNKSLEYEGLTWRRWYGLCRCKYNVHSNACKRLERTSPNYASYRYSEKPFDNAEADALYEFVTERGGKVIIAANSTNAQTVADKFDVKFSMLQ